MNFNNEDNDWFAYKFYVMEELKGLKESLEKLRGRVDEIKELVVETKTKVLGLTIGIPTIISLIIAAIQVYVGG
jgi:hypothetical protein